jgi:preprotein translocase subunit SecF
MTFEIIPNKNTWFAFSGFLVTCSVACIGFFGLEWGIDFTGGTQMEVSFEKSIPNITDFGVFFQEATNGEKGEKIVQTLDKSAFIVRSKSFTDEEVMSLQSALSQQDWGAQIDRVNTIGPTVGAVFKERAYYAIFLAIVAIILFVAFAFRKVPEGLSSWRFGMAAIVALAHDILIIIGLFSLLGHFYGIEVDTLFITALLTVLGFSVNDTIVIFDRVRENLKGEKNLKHFGDVSEKALWQSMRRSVNTSVSTLLVIVTMLFFFLGFPALSAFFIALSAGIIIGTYSSLFVAVPLLVLWHQKK